MDACPACGRPVAVPRPRCLYCGAALSPRSVASAAARAERARPGPAADSGAAEGGGPRALIVLDLRGSDRGAVADALGLSPFDAERRVRQGGCQLHRIAPAAEARAEAARLRAHGIRAEVIAEAGVREAARPVLVLGGRMDGEVLAMRTDEGPAAVEARELLLVVRGPIVREYMAELPGRNRPRSVPLEGGHRIHLHRRASPRPLELDPGSFEFGGPGEGGPASSLVRLAGWIAGLGGGVAVDEGFRLLSPALAPSAGEAKGVLSAVDALRAPTGRKRRGRGERVVLDNLAQFRFYSAWRGLAERGLAAPPG